MSEQITKSRKGIGGPKTKEGKERVKLNALKIGFHARTIEGCRKASEAVGVSFDSVHQQMRDYYQPADPVEDTLVRRIARCSWKLLVLEKIEDYTLNWLMVRKAPNASLGDISVIERRTDVQLHRAIAAIAAERKDEQEKVENKLPAPLALSNEDDRTTELHAQPTPVLQYPYHPSEAASHAGHRIQTRPPNPLSVSKNKLRGGVDIDDISNDASRLPTAVGGSHGGMPDGFRHWMAE